VKRPEEKIVEVTALESRLEQAPGEREGLVLANGMRRQTFEGGSIDYDPATGIPVLRTPISTINVLPTGTLSLQLGDTRQIQATLTSANGTVLSDRTIAWNTSNGRVVQIQANGLTSDFSDTAEFQINITVTA